VFPATTEFFCRAGKDRNGLERLTSRCKTCRRAYRRAYAKNRKADDAQSLRLLLDEQQCIREKAYQHAYYKVRKKQLLLAKRAQKKIREEEAKAAKRAYREAHRPEPTTWQQKHRDQYNEYQRQRRQDDPKVRISQNMYSKIGAGLRGEKPIRTLESYVGYSPRDLRRHLESLFQPGMTWENYGKGGWQIDHVRPLASFDFDSVEHPQFRECWALDNLQPLWAGDNSKKGAIWQGEWVHKPISRCAAPLEC
jgi:hypothetical protein